MASPFVLIIPGYPMITQFQQIESTRFVTSLPNPASIAELCFSVNPNIQIPECGIALYYSFNPNEGWRVLGTVTTDAPSGIFRTGWGTMGVENLSSVSIGVSLESGDFVSNLKGIIQSPLDRELPVMNVAQDLYNFISSFSEPQFGKLVLPADIFDRWIDKTKKRL
ncbi:hypothetical protein WA556_004500, partial [Blastocystis sp. ATCC 50177/Nand II]